MVLKLFSEPRDDEHQNRYVTVAELKRVLREIIVALSVMLVVFGAAMTFALALITASQQQIKRQAQAIQHSRYEAIRDACRQTNERHDRTIARLEEVASKRTQGADLRSRVNASVFLINAIVPKVPNCEAFAHQRSALP